MTLTNRDYSHSKFWTKAFRDPAVRSYVGVVLMDGQEEFALLTCGDARELGLSLIDSSRESVSYRDYMRKLEFEKTEMVRRLTSNWNL